MSPSKRYKPDTESKAQVENNPPFTLTSYGTRKYYEVTLENSGLSETEYEETRKKRSAFFQAAKDIHDLYNASRYPKKQTIPTTFYSVGVKNQIEVISNHIKYFLEHYPTNYNMLKELYSDCYALPGFLGRSRGKPPGFITKGNLLDQINECANQISANQNRSK